MVTAAQKLKWMQLLDLRDQLVQAQLPQLVEKSPDAVAAIKLQVQQAMRSQVRQWFSESLVEADPAKLPRHLAALGRWRAETETLLEPGAGSPVTSVTDMPVGKPLAMAPLRLPPEHVWEDWLNEYTRRTGLTLRPPYPYRPSRWRAVLAAVGAAVVVTVAVVKLNADR